MPERPWTAPRATGPLAGRVVVPGSKSQTNRALLLAGLAENPSVLDGVLVSRDSDLMRAGLTSLGVGFEDLGPGRVRVDPHLHPAEGPIHCGLAGTVMRFLPVVAAIAGGTTFFDGDPRSSERPVGPVLDGLRQLGVITDSDHLPFRLDAPSRLRGRSVTIDSSASSQFVSALLLGAARMPEGIDLCHSGPPMPSAPHVAMTCRMLADRGVDVDTPEPDHWVVGPGPIAGIDQAIEPDLTNAAVFLAAALVAGGTVSVPGWPATTTQPGEFFCRVAELMGATVRRDDSVLTVSCDGHRQLHGLDVDLHEASELTPVVVALAVLAHGPSRIRGVAHIRGHETDRLAALEDELGRLGADISQTDDGLAVEGGGPEVLHAGPFGCHADHRMAHAGALVGLAVDGVELDDVSCTSKTMPDFPAMWSHLVGGEA